MFMLSRICNTRPEAELRLSSFMYYSNVDSLGLKNTYKDIDSLQSGYVCSLPPFEKCCSVVCRASVCSITTFK